MFPERTSACALLTQEQVYPEGLQPVQKTVSGSGEQEECEAEGAVKKSCYGLTTAPIPHLLYAMGDGNELNFPQPNSVFPVMRADE